MLEHKQGEMLRLHHTMIRLVNDLDKLVSPGTSQQSLTVMPVSPDCDCSSLASAPPASVRTGTIKEEAGMAPVIPSLPSTDTVFGRMTMEERSHRHTAQQHKIHNMVTYINLRAAHYYKSRPPGVSNILCLYPKVDWTKLNPNLRRNLHIPE